MPQKIPPPVGAATKDPVFNRWLVNLIDLLNAEGDVDPGSIAGLAALVAQVAANTAAITALNGQVAANTVAITALNTLTGTHTTQIAALTARAQVFEAIGVPAPGLGNTGDWYANTTGGVGARIYIKTAPGTWTPFPF